VKKINNVLPKDKFLFKKYLDEVNELRTMPSYAFKAVELLKSQGYLVTIHQIRNCKSGRYDYWEVLNAIRIVYGFEPVEIPKPISEESIAKAFNLQKQVA
jgi:hypothetical protein